MGLRLAVLSLMAFLVEEYSLECLRASMAVFRLFTKAQLWMALLGKCLNWFRMIWPCTTMKRSTAAICDTSHLQRLSAVYIQLTAMPTPD